jgi:DNA polymerase II large subunit
MTTVSPQLRDDLVTLIESMDYVATRKEVSPRYLRDAFPDFYDEDDDSTGKDAWRIRLEDYNEFISKNGIQLMRKQGSIKRDYETKDVLEVKTEEVSLENTYNITTRNGGLEINNSHSFQCDGDEDSVMLLMDGLVNYSEEYLNHDRRGWSMDRPLVMTTHVDPGEIDDEAHNVETVREFSLEFYKATVENKHPKDVLDEVEIGEDHIEDELVEGFNHAIETSSIDAGPVNSAYKTLGDMEEKTGEQLRVARLIRASDVDDVAMKVVDSHFIPDLMGNLAAFGRQDVRCTNCNTKYGRPPLRDMCTNCGQESLILTVHEGSVTKYLDLSLEMSQKYEFKPYLAQRLEEIEQKINSLFEDDKEKQTGLSDFM